MTTFDFRQKGQEVKQYQSRGRFVSSKVKKSNPNTGATLIYNFIILPSLKAPCGHQKEIGNCEKFEEEILSPSSGSVSKPKKTAVPECGSSPKFLRKKFDSIKRKLYRQYLPNDMDLYRKESS